MSKTQLIVMAAGIGSRYGGLKQIDPVGPSSEIVLDYSIYDAIKAGFSKVVFVIRKDIEDAFRSTVGKNIEPRIETQYVFQELTNIPSGFDVPCDRTKPWGTGHAVLCANESITAPFAVINADDFYGVESFRVLNQYLTQAADTDLYDYCMVGFQLKNTLSDHGHVARGVCTADTNSKLQEITERTKIIKSDDEVQYTENDKDWIPLPPDSTVSMNMWGFTPSFMNELSNRFPRFLEENISIPKSEFFIPSVVNDLLRENKASVTILPTREKWFGVTYREDRPAVKNAIQNLVTSGVYPDNLWR